MSSSWNMDRRPGGYKQSFVVQSRNPDVNHHSSVRRFIKRLGRIDAPTESCSRSSQDRAEGCAGIVV